MRVLITGASGFLGYHLARYLEGKNTVLGTYHKKHVIFDFARSAALDFRSPIGCMKMVSRFSPTHIVHAGAMSLTGPCQKKPEEAHATNVQGTSNLLRAASDLRARPHFVYISTDLVFDGTKGNYGETDACNPVMVYGKTKLEAEAVVAQYPGAWTIIRSALMYGPMDPARPSFLNWMTDGIRTGVGAFLTDEYRTPIYVEDLCGLITTGLERGATGIFHAGGGERRSRYEFALLVADVFGLPQGNVRGVPTASVPAETPRPADVSLNITKAREQLGFEPTPAQEALTKIKPHAA